jgi:hypothetical protein
MQHEKDDKYVYNFSLKTRRKNTTFETLVCYGRTILKWVFKIKRIFDADWIQLVEAGFVNIVSKLRAP